MGARLAHQRRRDRRDALLSRNGLGGILLVGVTRKQRHAADRWRNPDRRPRLRHRGTSSWTPSISSPIRACGPVSHARFAITQGAFTVTALESTTGFVGTRSSRAGPYADRARAASGWPDPVGAVPAVPGGLRGSRPGAHRPLPAACGQSRPVARGAVPRPRVRHGRVWPRRVFTRHLRCGAFAVDRRRRNCARHPHRGRAGCTRRTRRQGGGCRHRAVPRDPLRAPPPSCSRCCS